MLKLEDIISEAMETLGYYLILIRTILNWRIVRGVSELQVLARASYFMLIFVPVLAGLWPGVRLYVNQHNKAVTDLTEIMEATYEEYAEKEKQFQSTLIVLDNTQSPASGSDRPAVTDLSEVVSSLKESSATIRHQVQRFRDDFAPKTIETPTLPWTWATAFFAALFVALAHLIYQLFAPETVRRYTLDEFVVFRKEDYAKHPTDGAVQRANEYSQSAVGAREAVRERYEIRYQIQRLADEKDWKSALKSIPSGLRRAMIENLEYESSIEELSSKLGEILGGLKRIESEHHTDTSGPDIRKLTLIERGARAEYLESAGKRLSAIFCTAIVYSLGLYLILSIVFAQAIAVIRTAGWSSMGDLFDLPF